MCQSVYTCLLKRIAVVWFFYFRRFMAMILHQNIFRYWERALRLCGFHKSVFSIFIDSTPKRSIFNGETVDLIMTMWSENMQNKEVSAILKILN